jgi:hypothetical protein
VTLPSSGPISLAQLRDEFGGTNPVSLGQYYRGGSLVPNSTLNASVPTSGAISLSQFYGTSRVAPGSANYTTAGAYSFVVPLYNVLIVDVKGASGGSGGGRPIANYAPWAASEGTAGGASSFGAATTVSATGGAGGGAAHVPIPPPQNYGAYGQSADGVGQNGDINTTGAGAPKPNTVGEPYGGYAGSGGRAQKTYTAGAAGAPTPGTTITIMVGGKGIGGAGTLGGSAGPDGSAGSVVISWS